MIVAAMICACGVVLFTIAGLALIDVFKDDVPDSYRQKLKEANAEMDKVVAITSFNRFCIDNNLEQHQFDKLGLYDTWSIKQIEDMKKALLIPMVAERFERFDYTSS